MYTYRRTITFSVLVALSACILGCKDAHEKAADERREARQEISDAQQNVAEKEQKAARDVSKAVASGDADTIQDEKIDATKAIAKAKGKVEDEKVEATEEITEAEKKAGETQGTYTRE
ncbi:MAG: hypothetical protein J0M12_15460 [Deltaproteobacteria bacterium]|nr:hypothetical protein [Deltaproteobacteria bacterium]